MESPLPTPKTPHFSAEQAELVAEFAQTLRPFAAPGRYAVTLGGSHAKGTADALSDFDFRLYADAFGCENWKDSLEWEPFRIVKEKWKARGYRNSFWLRTVADIDAQLDRWSAGNIEPAPVVWSVWGYQVLTDIAAQYAVDDPDGLVADWHQRLKVYPPALKSSILRQHGQIIRYWKADYHVESKVARGDSIFLAGVSAKIVHSLAQIVFALNETYFPGDGWSAHYQDDFWFTPQQFRQRVTAALYPTTDSQHLARQRSQLLELIGEVESIMTK